jgi:hypothetical protein
MFPWAVSVSVTDSMWMGEDDGAETRTSPKSRIFGRPSSLTMTLPGFRSRWTTPWP